MLAWAFALSCVVAEAGWENLSTVLIGILNVKCLGYGLFCVLMASSVAVAASFSTLNSKILSYSDVAHESRV